MPEHNYKLTITRTKPNDQFEAQLKEYRDKMDRPYQQQLAYPERDIVEKTLETTLTEAEFAAIKKAALEVM